MSDNWMMVASAVDLPTDDVIGADVDGQFIIIVRDERGKLFASDGVCTHEAVRLSEGFVMDGRIICPKHGGEFDYRSGQAVAGPVCEHLQTWQVVEKEGKIWVSRFGGQ